MTPEQKTTITNFFSVSSLESLNSDTDGKRYPDNPGGSVFVSRMAYDVVDSTPPPVDLWHGLWHQGEMACLFGEPNVGKTILAMRIAADIVKRQLPVLYFDFENAEHQLLPRYLEHSFHDENAPAFEIVTPNYDNPRLPRSNRGWLTYIHKRALENNVNVIIIDDITHLFGTGDPGDVRYVLNTLRSWVKQHRLSILVIAHARRRKPLQPITLEHLAGSFECAYSFDSVFSLSKANRYNRRTRGISAYIKQHKSRMGDIIYDDENVITARLRFDEDTKSLTMCDLTDGGNERQLLRDFGFHSHEEILQAVLDYKSKFYTLCEIADRVGISKSQVGRLLQKHYADQQPAPPDKGNPVPPMPDGPINPYPVNSHAVIDQGGVDTLLCDDSLLPMRRHDPDTGKTYIYYPDGDFSVEIKPDEFTNLPLYHPSEENNPEEAAQKQDLSLKDFSRSDSPETTSQSTPSAESPSNDEQNNAQSAALCATPAVAPEENNLDDDDYDEDDDDKPFDKPWDPCAYEEPVTPDPAYYEFIRTH